MAAGAVEDPRAVELLQHLAQGECAAVLPDDCVRNRTAGGLVPEDRGLALIRNADGLDLGGRDSGSIDNLLQGVDRDLEDLRRVVLDPAGLRVVLGKLSRCCRHDLAVVINE
jgi:hypothetical protein